MYNCNVGSQADADEPISCELSLELGQGSSRQISSADHRNTTVGSKHTHFQISLDQIYSWASRVYLEEVLLDIGGA